MHSNNKRGSYNGGHGHSGRWGNTNGRKFSERRDGHQYQRYGDHNRDRYDDRRRDGNHHQSSSSSQDGRNYYDRHSTYTSYEPKNGNGRYRDQQDRGGGDERKRPASPLPTESAAVVNTTIHQKRAKSDESSTTTDPTEQSNNVELKISATTAPTAISVSNDQMTEGTSYKAQLDANKAAYVECLREVDQELFHVSNQAHEVPRPGWDEMKESAVESTLKELEHIKRQDYNDNEEYYSSDESLPPGCSGSPKKPSTGLTQGEIRFIKAFPHCLPLNAGFQVLQVGGSGICYCPCGPNLGPWRSKHKIFCDRICTKKSFDPNDLMDHLKAEGGLFEEKEHGRQGKIMRPLRDIFHHAARLYLTFLYTDWHGKGFGHKALYPRLSPLYKKGANEETRILEREIIVGRRVIKKQDKEKAELRAELDKKAKEARLFKKLAADHSKKIDHLEALRAKFEVEERVQEKELSDSAIKRYSKLSTKNFDMIKGLVGVLKDGVKITVLSESGDSGFSLQHFFDDMYTQKGEDAHTLFGDDNTNNKIDKRILSQWEITFDKREDYSFYKRKADAKAQKKGDTGKDEGGPSRQFLTDVFRQLGALSISLGDKTFNLFENTSSGAMVTTDEMLEEFLKPAAKEKREELLKQAKSYARAIGRIMLHAFAHKDEPHSQRLPSTSMPPFIINVLLRGYDERYYKDDILKHITMLDVPGQKTLEWILGPGCDELDENGNEWTKETFFQKYIPNTFINSRSLLLGGIKDGLTLLSDHSSSGNLVEGCGISSVFSEFPTEAIQRIHFAKPYITLEDLLGALNPKFGEGEPDINWGMSEKDKERHVEEQILFYKNGFMKYLKESAEEDESFLVRFVECATGSNYLPFDKNFKINIEFNFSLDVSMPKFHSCTRDVMIPGVSVFFSDYESFKNDKMNYAINEVYNQFNME